MEEKRQWSRDDIAAMDNEWILLHLIFCYKEDWGDRKNGKWSDETCDLWDEAVHRMKEPVIHGLDRDRYVGELRQQIDNQTSIMKSAQESYSYHYGIRSGLQTALNEFKRSIRDDGGKA